MSGFNHVTGPGQLNIYACPYCSPSARRTAWTKAFGKVEEFDSLDFSTDQGRAMVERWVTQLVLTEICEALSKEERDQITVSVSTQVAELIDKGLRKKAGMGGDADSDPGKQDHSSAG